MAPSRSVIICVNALLASTSHEEERGHLAVLVNQCAGNDASRAWWDWVRIEDGSNGLQRRVLLYAIYKAYACNASLSAVFKGDARIEAETIPALSNCTAASTDTVQVLLKMMTAAMWSADLLQPLHNVITQIEDPRVRQQAIQFAYTILRHEVQAAPTVEWVHAAIPVLLLGVTDVWSAIRKESARSVQRIVFQFSSLELIDLLIDSLLNVVTMNEAWTAQEGALLALSAIVASIQTDKPAASILNSNALFTVAKQPSAPSAIDMIKGSGHAAPVVVVFHIGERHRNVAQLPRPLALRLKPTVYTALKHAQVAVRGAAAQCLVQYMGICVESTRILTFQEVVTKLNWLSPATTTATPDSGNSDDHQSNHHVELLEAAEAEGLLDVLAQLVPRLPVHFLVKHWKFVYPTLERYVMHIASSVRQRGSAVVLALAEFSRATSLSKEGAVESMALSLELLHQMLVALAEHRVVEIGLCWQRLEGRLLSVDLVVRLLGTDLLAKQSCGAQSLLHFASHPRKSVASNKDHSVAWLPDAMVPQATWTLDEDEEAHLQTQTKSKLLLPPIIERLNSHVTSIAFSSDELWRHVLSGWLSQTFAAFESTQFELRRIARQLLPGLVRLCMWCEQVALLTMSCSRQAEAKSPNADVKANGWTWLCLRHCLLHAQLLQEYSGVTSKTLVQNAHTFVIETISSVGHTRRHEDDAEAAVGRVETIAMAYLSCPPSDTNKGLMQQQLHNAFADVHAHIPASYQHCSGQSAVVARHDASLDRHFSIALVRLLPVIAARWADSEEIEDQQDLWHFLERITLSWLASDDIFRWITIDKEIAHASLMQTLRALLTWPNAADSAKDDAALIVRTLEEVIPTQNASPAYGTKGSLSTNAASIYASLWRSISSDPAARVHTKIVMNLARLNHVEPKKDLVGQSARSEWDEWDDDNGSDKEHEIRPTDSSVPESPVGESWVAQVIFDTLQEEQLESFRSTLRSLVDTQDSVSTGVNHDALVILARSLSLVHAMEFNE